MSETRVQAAIWSYLRANGIPAIRVNQGSMKRDGRYVQFTRGMKGVSDLIGCIPPAGRFLAVEVKYGKNKPTKDQRHFLDLITETGGLAIVAYSIEDVQLALMSEGIDLPAPIQ